MSCSPVMLVRCLTYLGCIRGELDRLSQSVVPRTVTIRVRGTHSVLYGTMRQRIALQKGGKGGTCLVMVCESEGNTEFTGRKLELRRGVRFVSVE